MEAAIDWLKRAQDIGEDDGISYGYYLRGQGKNPFRHGWRESYVETSGYCVETLFDLANHYHVDDYHDRAIRLANWLCTRQNTDGSFSNQRISGMSGIVFDTGQVLFGLQRAFSETQDVRYKRAALRAANWLMETQDQDGAWKQNTHMDRVHAYNARSAWALSLCENIMPDQYKILKDAVERNLEWTANQQLKNGLFINCGFKNDDAPFTHTIAYTIRGLLEGGLKLDNKHFVNCAQIGADALLPLIEKQGFLSSRVDVTSSESLKGKDRSSCLTGNCQFAIIYFRLNEISPDPKYIQAANLLLDYVMATQNMSTQHQGIRGGIRGSDPIWGSYTPMAYPNWAAKFFIDAMLLRAKH